MARTASLFGTFAARAERVRQRAEQARHSAKRVARELGRNLGKAREEAEATAASLGMPMHQGPVIDLGKQPSPLQRIGAAVAAAALALLVAGSLVSFTSFMLQFLLAALIASRVLGVNLDLAAARPQG